MMPEDPREVPEAEEPLWRFIPLDRYARPEDPTEAVRRGLAGLWSKWKRSVSRGEESAAEREVESVPSSVLDLAAPAPDWTDAVPALDAALGPWVDGTGPDGPVRILVGFPHSGTEGILRCWAASRGLPVVEAPEPEEILERGVRWATEWGAGDAPVVLPRLERFYFRHHDGLDLMYHLLEAFASGRRRWVVACDSWAWAYLSKALQIQRVLPKPLALEAFGPDRLDRWFRTGASKDGKCHWTFRDLRSGRRVLSAAGDTEENDARGKGGSGEGTGRTSQSVETDSFLKHLSAWSHGIPGVAQAFWRHNLRWAVNEEATDEARKESLADGGRTLWVTSWSKVRSPRPPDPGSQNHLLLLHALLLHGGLREDLAARLLPLSAPEVSRGLHELHALGLIEDARGAWRVTALGYPAVRGFIQRKGYLLDLP